MPSSNVVPRREFKFSGALEVSAILVTLVLLNRAGALVDRLSGPNACLTEQNGPEVVRQFLFTLYGAVSLMVALLVLVVGLWAVCAFVDRVFPMQ